MCALQKFLPIKKPMRVYYPLPTRNTFALQYSAQLHRTIPEYFTLNQTTNIYTFTLHRKLKCLLHIHKVQILLSQLIIWLLNHTTLRTKTEHQSALLVFNKCGKRCMILQLRKLRNLKHLHDTRD